MEQLQFFKAVPIYERFVVCSGHDLVLMEHDNDACLPAALCRYLKLRRRRTRTRVMVTTAVLSVLAVVVSVAVYGWQTWK